MSDRTLLWIGCGGCSGETQALLGVEGQASDLLDLLDVDGVRLLWHPRLAEQELGPVHEAVVDGREHLTVLCVEGSVALAEDGMFDIAGPADAQDAGADRAGHIDRGDSAASRRPGPLAGTAASTPASATPMPLLPPPEPVTPAPNPLPKPCTPSPLPPPTPTTPWPTPSTSAVASAPRPITPIPPLGPPEPVTP